ncbi:MAG: universal stress protein, partial [Actinomycetota bacterium]|nr:universal stress protein [Actinomycetota bacterium]
MFERVVICTDLSEESDRLVNCVGELKILGMREVVLTHVVDIFGDSESGRDRHADEAVFEQQIQVLESRGLKVHIDAPLGYPAFSLDEAARRFGASLIVVGSHGKGVFDAPFSGSVSSDLVLLSETPILVTSLKALGDQQACTLVCRRILDHILYATDFSKAAERAFSKLEQVVELGAKDITIVHIQDRERIEREGRGRVEEYDRRDEKRLAYLRERLRSAGATQASYDLVYGTPADELAMRAESGEFTLIVMGNRGRGSQGSFLGGASDRVIRG